MAAQRETSMAIHFYEEDLPGHDLFAPDAAIAVDTEAMGLIPGRRRPIICAPWGWSRPG